MKFDELSEKIKEKILTKFYNINIDYEWWNSTIDDIKNELENEFGMVDIKINFSGFANQGDGASFTGKINDFEKFINKIKINPIIEFTRNDSHYFHENTVSCDIGDVEDLIEEWRYQKCKEIYRKLENEYDYLISDETIEETIKLNNYEFDEEGNLV